MSALAVPVPMTAPARRVPAARPVRRGHLELVGPHFVPVSDRVAAVGATPQPRLRLTARGRLVRSLAALVLAAAAAVAAGGWLGGAVAGASQYDGPTATVSVGAGQTLWEIAATSAAGGQDVREVVSQIQQLNSLPTGDLAAGQQLVVPAG